MAPSRFDYSKLSFLIIDDFSNFASALRTMILAFGADKIDIVLNGEDAVQTLNKTRYDVVLCDYNLGDGKNGNEVHEEAKTQGLLKSSTLFMMITAENSSEMVRGALEYQPDDYLTKPFTKEVLLNRLERLLIRSLVFKSVYQAEDHGQLHEALERIDEVVAANPRYRRYGQRLKSQYLLKLEAYQEAADLFQQVLDEKPLPWAKLGLGKSNYYLDRSADAEQDFRNLLNEDRGYVQAWDWLARCQERKQDYQGAQVSLHEAVKISPINVRRQANLGDLAVENGDTDRAEMAYGRAVKYGKHSVFRSPDSYLKLTEILVKKLDEGGAGLEGKRIEVKALNAMDELRTLYRDDSEICLKSRFVDHQVHSNQGRTHEAQASIFRAYDACAKDTEGKLPAALKEQLISSLEEMGRDDMVAKVVDAMQHEESNLNTQAVSFYDKGDFDGALDILKQAAKDKPRSYSICLNTAQVAIHYMIKKGKSEELLELAGGALERAKGLNEDDRRYGLYQNLIKRYEKLKM